MPAASSRLEFDPARPADVTLRIKPLFIVLFFCVAAASAVVFAMATWSSGIFDPRLPFIAVQIVFCGLAIARSRIVVVDGVLWRRGLFRYRPLDLKHLATVEFSRPRPSKNEGFIFRMLRLTDTTEQSIALKPIYWTRGVRKLVGVVETSARSQQVQLSDKTRASFASYAADMSGMPTWTRRDEPDDEPVPMAPLESTFWTRRNPDGTEKKLQLQRLVAMVPAMVLMFPAMWAIREVGTNAVSSAKCATTRHLWTNAPEFAERDYAIAPAAMRVAMEPVLGRPGQLFTLEADQLFNHNNSAAVQAGSKRMVDGIDVGWATNGVSDADVYFQHFATHAEAMQLQSDYAEDHCHDRDFAFGVAAVPGAVGINCRCHGDFIREKITFVRGNVRVVVSVWQAPRSDKHATVTRLALAALEGLEVPSA